MTRPFSDLTRHEWRRRWLNCIQCYGDTHAHERWPDASDKNPHFSYVECAAAYFLDCGLEEGYAMALRAGYVSSEEVSAVANFDRLARAYEFPGKHREDPAIVADEGWPSVVSAAQEARDRLRPLIADPEEIVALTQAPEWTEDSLGYRCDFLGKRHLIPREDKGLLARLRKIFAS